MNVSEVVPFFAVKDMRKSLAFYVDGLGFKMEGKWVDEGVIRWCMLRIGNAAVMLQEFRTEGHDSRQFSENKGEGVSLFFFCDDAVGYYRNLRNRGIDASEPQVGNGMWVTSMSDPDGYNLYFQSPTDVPEETKLSEVE
ncbi:MAG: VOC family protein [Gemmatimonadota bacterium]|nr:VOC family protein [Gemmatimonadota bacterium]